MAQNPNQDIIVLKDSPDADSSSLEVESGEISNSLSPAAQAVTDLIESQTFRELSLVQTLEFNPAEDSSLLTGIIHKLHTVSMRLLDEDYSAIYAEKARLYEAAANQMLDANFDKNNPDLANLPITLNPLEDAGEYVGAREVQRTKAVFPLIKLIKDLIVERRKLSGQLYGAANIQGRQLGTTMSYKKAKLTGKQLLAQLPQSIPSRSIISEPERIVNNVFNLNAPNRSAEKKQPAPVLQDEEQSDRLSDYYQEDF